MLFRPALDHNLFIGIEFDAVAALGMQIADALGRISYEDLLAAASDQIQTARSVQTL